MQAINVDVVAILSIFALAIISPGPNFIFVVNRSLSDSRKCGLYSAFGVATGSGIFAASGLLGLLMVIDTVPHFSTLLRFVGGGYLVYLGISMLLSSRQPMIAEGNTQQRDSMLPVAAYLAGLFTNLTNPKAWAFYLSLFTLMTKNDFTFLAKMIMASSMFAISLGWYALMAVLISDRRVQGRFIRMQPIFKLVLGLVLALIGGRLLLQV